MAGKGGRTAGTWKKGENPRMQKGAKHKATILKESVGLNSWEKLKSFIENEGAEKLVDEMQDMTGKNYVIAYSTLAEFIKPKLQRTTVVGEEDQPLVVKLEGGTIEELYKLAYGSQPETK